MKNSYIVLGLSLVSLFSCTNQVEEVAVSSQQTRAIASTPSSFAVEDGILRFSSMEAYEEVLQDLRQGSPDDNVHYFSNYGFTSLSAALQSADTELDQICQAPDQNLFDALYTDYKTKYASTFMFNDLDQSDLSVYSKLRNPEDNYFANTDGVYYIGDSLVVASSFESFNDYQNLISTHDNSTNASVNHAWSHQSKRKVALYIYLDKTDGDINIKLTAQKKNLFGWVRYSTNYYFVLNVTNSQERVYLQLSPNFTSPAYVPNKLVDITGISTQIHTRELGGNTDLYVGKTPPNDIPLVAFIFQGQMSVWSNGIAHEVRGQSRVHHCSNTYCEHL